MTAAPAPSPLSRPSSQTGGGGVTISPLQGAERAESRKGETVSYQRRSLLIIFIQIKKKKAPTPVAVFLW